MRICVCVCVCEGCVSRVHRRASGADIEPAVVSDGEKEAQRPVSLRPPRALLITAVLPRRCLYGASLKKEKKGGRFADLTGCSGCCNRKNC